MSAEPQSGLPEVNIVSTLEPPEQGDEAETVKETSPESSPSNVVQPVSTANIHPKIVKALSQVPYSPLFGVLWPTIIEQASFETRDIFRQVNTYFETLCHPFRRSDRAKRSYVSHDGNRQERNGLPYVLDLSFEVEWRCWGADKCGFNSIDTFLAFCAVGDIDPDQGRGWDPYESDFGLFRRSPDLMHIWMSRTKDIVFETSRNPFEDGGVCHYFGLSGVADKAIAMYNFMHDNYGEFDESEFGDEPATMWAEMAWSRDYC